MRRNNFQENYGGVSSDFIGDELERAYAEILGGLKTGGEGDEGKDIINIEEVGAVQVKSTFENARKFLAESLRRKRFIPLVIGQPGSKEEMIESIKRFGAWVGYDIPNREKDLENIAKVRDVCYS